MHVLTSWLFARSLIHSHVHSSIQCQSVGQVSHCVTVRVLSEWTQHCLFVPAWSFDPFWDRFVQHMVASLRDAAAMSSAYSCSTAYRRSFIGRWGCHVLAFSGQRVVLLLELSFGRKLVSRCAWLILEWLISELWICPSTQIYESGQTLCGLPVSFQRWCV